MSQINSSRINLRFNKNIPPVFQIDHLECSYVPGQVVLKASDISIPRNYVTILLGPSGAGKSQVISAYPEIT